MTNILKSTLICFFTLLLNTQEGLGQTDKEQSRLGKYYCAVENAIGIQYETDKYGAPIPGTVFAGKIKLQNERFFAEVTRNTSDCQSIDSADCKRSYKIEVKQKGIIRGDVAYSDGVSNFSSFYGSFDLYAITNRFSAITRFPPNNYIVHGLCEKVN